jgi:hypothetical protein
LKFSYGVLVAMMQPCCVLKTLQVHWESIVCVLSLVRRTLALKTLPPLRLTNLPFLPVPAQAIWMRLQRLTQQAFAENQRMEHAKSEHPNRRPPGPAADPLLTLLSGGELLGMWEHARRSLFGGGGLTVTNLYVKGVPPRLSSLSVCDRDPREVSRARGREGVPAWILTGNGVWR